MSMSQRERRDAKAKAKAEAKSRPPVKREAADVPSESPPGDPAILTGGPTLRGRWASLVDRWTCSNDQCRRGLAPSNLVFKSRELAYCAPCACSDEMPGGEERARELMSLTGRRTPPKKTEVSELHAPFVAPSAG